MNDHESKTRPKFRWIFLVAFALTLALLVALRRVEHSTKPALDVSPAGAGLLGVSGNSTDTERSPQVARSTAVANAPTAEQVVADKFLRFTRSRREVAREMARRKGVEVPDAVERFFDALESGNWSEINSQFASLSKSSRQYEDSTSADSPRLDPVWCAVLDAYGVAEQVHEWPAQKLLDYGNAILDSLRPGMVYVGGTDNGRWIPTLLNETSDREPHVLITQNALADGRYVEYMNTLYGDRFATLTEADSQRAFQDYVVDAQRRLEHDMQFPDEPKQLRFGEEVTKVDGKVQVGGQVAVMAINEKLLQALMAKNPDLDFAVQESSPLRGTYADALPLGPLMELEARDGQDGFTPERATQSLDYWRGVAQQVFSDPEAMASTYTLKSYSHDTVSAANLLAAHNFLPEAEAGYRLAVRLWPGNPESIGGLADLLARDGRDAEARQLIASFYKDHPDQRKDLDRVSATARIMGPVTITRP